jgi:hypothetical protein
VALGVWVAENARLQELVVRVVDSWDDERGAEGELLVLGKEVVGVAVEDEASDGL